MAKWHVFKLFLLFRGKLGQLGLVIFLGIITTLLDGIGMSYLVPLFEVFGLSVSGASFATNNRIIDALTRPLMRFPGHSRLYVFLGAIITIAIIKNALTYYEQSKAVLLENRILTDLRKDIFHKILNAPLSYFNELKFGHVASILQQQTYEISLGARALMRAFSEIIVITVFGAFMFILSIKLTLVTLGTLILASISLQWIQRSVRKLSHAFVAANNKFSSIMLESLNNMRLIKTYAAEHNESSKFDRAAEEVGGALYRRVRKMLLTPPIVELLFVFVLTVILLTGSMLLKGYGEAKTAVLIAFVVILYRTLNAVKDLNVDRIKLADKEGPLKSVFSVLEERKLVMPLKDGKVKFAKLTDSIRFKGVRFGYSKGDKILDNINLIIPAGKTVGIVGASAAGKSTLVNLLIRLYDPIEGEIFIDGVDVKQYEIKSVREKIGFVPQETYLFNMTIAENIIFGREKTIEGDVIKAAKMAGVHDFILELRDGYNTNIGERGVKLSGGQRQRIAIARAVLHKPDILILDEATSALDTVSEKEVQNTIKDLKYPCTKIVIAHRLSTVRDADKIVVLAGGRIVEEGTHEELLGMEGAYSSLYNAK